MAHSKGELSDDFLREYKNQVYSNIDKTEKELNKYSLYILVVLIAYFLVQFGEDSSFAIGPITIKKTELVILLAPLVYGFLLLRTYLCVLFLNKVVQEYSDCIKREHGECATEKLFYVQPFNIYRSFLHETKDSPLITIFLFLPTYLLLLVFLLGFQYYLLRSTESVLFEPYLFKSSCQLLGWFVSIILVVVVIRVIVSQTKNNISDKTQQTTGKK